MENQTETITTLEAYQRENSIRFKYIEDRLDEGSAKFKRLETIMWGVYPLIITTLLASRYI
tara:strand:+ start:746 stop:928 length:183 start_codon:yes stop_codon:yes gene_type:complete